MVLCALAQNVRPPPRYLCPFQRECVVVHLYMVERVSMAPMLLVVQVNLLRFCCVYFKLKIIFCDALELLKLIR